MPVAVKGPGDAKSISITSDISGREQALVEAAIGKVVSGAVVRFERPEASRFSKSRWENFLSGYVSAFDIRGKRFRSVAVSRSRGFKRDREALCGDGKKVRLDVQQVLRRMAANERSNIVAQL